ncbi:MAG: M23 family metallopeptidase [Thermodesulfovibrionia bacterium]|nr:M23 family metallopeptidase [Thermodesulfovibrionia bacterium]
MSGFDADKRGKSVIKKLGLVLGLPFIALLIMYLVYQMFFISPPVIEGLEAFDFIPVEKTITLNGKNLRSVEIFINQGTHRIELLRDIPTSSEKTYIMQIKPGDLQLTDGQATVVVNATSGIFKETKYEINSIIDTVPPSLDILKAPLTIDQGGGGVALLRAQDAESVFVKLVVPTIQDRSQENNTFKAFKTVTATDSESASALEFDSLKKPQTGETYFVFFPVPFDIQDGSVFYAIAEDTAGNQKVQALSTKLKIKKYKTSAMDIDDSFIKKVISPLLNETTISDPLSAFKKVNEDWREDNLNKLRELSRKTEQKILWKGRFKQLRNSKVMATYGDRRTYFYKGKQVSGSVHLGYDLASTANAIVDAANTGVVRFTGDLGIYGNTVIIDHGLGLMSLYGHLSTILVKEGHVVKKGEVIAKTGSTGLAGGDHLHFGILIHGYEISPLYWWDPRWVKTNVMDLLRE